MFMYLCHGLHVFLTGHCFILSHLYLVESNRLYFFVRVKTGDDLSVRSKFAFICWIGERVSPLKKAKMSTDKAEVKKVIQVRNCNMQGTLSMQMAAALV